jgi:Tfp pilus assembly protein PilO
MKDNLARIIFTTLIAAAIVLVVNEAANYFYFSTRADLLTKQRDKITEMKSSNDENERIKANADQLEQAFVDAERRYNLLKPLLPPEAELPKVLDWVTERATLRDLKLEHFSQGTRIQQQGAINEIPIQVEVLGYYDGVGRFLGDFARFERVLQVHGVRMVQEQQNPSAYTTVRANISFSAYVSKEKAPADTANR